MLMQYMLIIGVPSLINPTEQTDSNQPIKNKEVPQQLIKLKTLCSMCSIAVMCVT